MVTKTKVKVINFFLKTPVLLHIYADSAWKWQVACWVSSSRKSFTATVPRQVFPAAGGRTVERTLYASLRLRTVARYPLETPRSLCHRRTWTTHLTGRGHMRKRTRHVGDWPTIRTDYRLNVLHCETTVVTFFPLDPAHIVTWRAGAALVREHSLQVIVATVVGADVCKRSQPSFNYGSQSINQIYWNWEFF